MLAQNIYRSNTLREIARPEAGIFQVARVLRVEVAAVQTAIGLSCKLRVALPTNTTHRLGQKRGHSHSIAPRVRGHPDLECLIEGHLQETLLLWCRQVPHL